MFCKVCGRTIANENANFCEYCGTALNGRDDIFGGRQENPAQGPYQDAAGLADNSLTGILAGTAGTAQAENSMSFLHWIVVLLLPYIPIVGTFAYLVLLFAWSFGRTASTSRKNWARATLVMLAVAVAILSYAFGGMFSGGLSEMMDSFGMS